MACKTILIAEDNDDIRDALAEALTAEGYSEVYTAKNGKEALAKLKTIEHPTLVLLDLMMPVMTGWEFLAHQKGSRQPSSDQIVVMSAVPLHREMDSGAQSLAQASIQKPIDLRVLLNTVSHFC
jgi:two-component system response regulator CpxR